MENPSNIVVDENSVIYVTIPTDTIIEDNRSNNVEVLETSSKKGEDSIIITNQILGLNPPNIKYNNYADLIVTRQSSDPVTSDEKQSAINQIQMRNNVNNSTNYSNGDIESLDTNNHVHNQPYNHIKSSSLKESNTYLSRTKSSTVHSFTPLSYVARPFRESLKLTNYITNLSDTTPKEPVAIFYCDICLENHPISDMILFSACQQNTLESLESDEKINKRHCFCKSCLESYVSHQIKDGCIQIRCPHGSGCDSIATDNEVMSLVTSEIFEKYIRFQNVKSNVNYRECSACQKEIIINENLVTKNDNPSKAKSINMILTCSNCGKKTCFEHGDAHPNETCQQYIRRVSKEEKATMRIVDKIAKKCPSCHADTEKNGGCNHMTCQHCSTDWCWLCGRVMEDDHFGQFNLNGCPGAQFLTAIPTVTIATRRINYLSSHIPIFRILLSSINLLDYGIHFSLAILSTLLCGLICLLVGGTFALISLPFVLLLSSRYVAVCCTYCSSMRASQIKRSVENIPLVLLFGPGAITMFILVSAITLIGLPFAILFMIFMWVLSIDSCGCCCTGSIGENVEWMFQIIFHSATLIGRIIDGLIDNDD
eukprot:gene9044-12194_t